MPLPERVIQPVNISRGTLQYKVQDELEGVTNGSLCNIIRQLSSLSKHAEEIFGNLFKEARNISNRSSNLQARIDKLSIRVTQLDSSVDNGCKSTHPHFSIQKFDQQVLSRDTMPKAMMEAYMACDMPPPLHKLNPYRDDNVDAMTFYTNPKYFFELWRKETLKDTERVIQDKVKKHPNKSTSEVSSNGILKSTKGESIPAQRQLEDRHENLVKIQNINQNSILSGSSDHLSYVPSSHVRPTTVEEKYSLMNVDLFQNQMSHQRAASENVLRQQLIHQMPILGPNQSSTEVLRNTPRVLMAANQDQPPSPRYFQTSERHQVVDPHGQTEKKPLATVSMNNNIIENKQMIKNQPSCFESRLQDEPEDLRGHQIDKHSSSIPVNSSASVETSADFVTTITQDYVSPKFASLSNQDSISFKEQEFPPPPVTEPLAITKITVEPGRLSPSPAPLTGTADITVTEAPSAPPPPPPPPPSEPPMMNGIVTSAKKEPTSNTPATATPLPSLMSKQTVKKPLILPHFVKQDDARFDLLKAIQDGIVLKKVEQCEKAKIDRDSSFGIQGDVASILARRMAVEMSDSEDGGHGNSDYENDSDEWDDSTA